MTRNWCNQDQMHMLESRMGNNLVYVLTVNKMNSSFPKGGHSSTTLRERLRINKVFPKDQCFLT